MLYLYLSDGWYMSSHVMKSFLVLFPGQVAAYTSLDLNQKLDVGFKQGLSVMGSSYFRDTRLQGKYSFTLYFIWLQLFHYKMSG